MGFSWPCVTDQSADEARGPLMYSGGEDGQVQLRRLWASGSAPSSPLMEHVCTIGADRRLPPIVGGCFTPGNLLLVSGVVANSVTAGQSTAHVESQRIY